MKQAAASRLLGVFSVNDVYYRHADIGQLPLTLHSCVSLNYECHDSGREQAQRTGLLILRVAGMLDATQSASNYSKNGGWRIICLAAFFE